LSRRDSDIKTTTQETSTKILRCTGPVQQYLLDWIIGSDLTIRNSVSKQAPWQQEFEMVGRRPPLTCKKTKSKNIKETYEIYHHRLSGISSHLTEDCRQTAERLIEFYGAHHKEND
jgi:hypothetical protein